MRLAVATIMGGLIMFLWGAFAHMVLPLGEMSMRAPTDENRLLDTLRTALPQESGIYVIPHFDMATRHDDKAVQAYIAKAEANPYAFIVYQPQGRNPMAMGHNLFHQWLSDTLAALIIVLVLVRSGPSFSRGMAFGLGFGLFTWLTLSVPFWNWYRFPAPFTFGYLIEQAFGWLLAGAAMGWWLARRKRV
jgi:heme exporter protein D